MKTNKYPFFSNFFLIFFFTILIFAPPLQSIQAQAKDKIENPYLVIDADTGAILSANRAYDRWYPASLTKLMTAYVTMKAISLGEIGLGSPVRISKRARKMPASRMGYKTGTRIRIDTALKILIVKSANDVAIALAEAVGGNVEQFVSRMNNTASLLGLQNTNFTNPNGLHSPNQYVSARDLAFLARRLLLDFPQYAHWFAIPAIATSNKTHYSYNLLLERFEGANGMKTGFVCASGYNMVVSAKRHNRQLIAVILGTNSQTRRAVLAAKLLNEAFGVPDRIIGNINSDNTHEIAEPQNMRPVLCTKEARKNRYDPGAGKAVIKSPHLLVRKITQKPTTIKTGGIDGEPGAAYIADLLTPHGKIIIPTMRSQFKPANLSDNQGQLIDNLSGSILNFAPIPTLRPGN